MTTEQWFKWKKSLDPNFVIPSKEEQDRYEAEERLKFDEKNKKVEEEDDRFRFVVYYNHPPVIG